MESNNTPRYPTDESGPITGPARGDSELDTGPPHYHQPFEDIKFTPEEIAANKAHLAAIRAKLEAPRDRTS